MNEKKLSNEEKDRLFAERGWEFASPDWKEELETLKRRAGNGDTVSMLQLAKHYGNPAHRDPEKEKYWLEAAFAAGEEDAAYRRGMLALNEGDGPAGLEWFRKGAGAGSLDCLASLGRFYSQGRLVEKDPEKAVLYYKEAYAKARERKDLLIVEQMKYRERYEEAEKALEEQKKTTAAAEPVTRYREPVWFELLGILGCALLAVLTVLFVKIGAGRHGNEAEIVLRGFLVPLLVEILCMGGIVLLSGFCLGNLTFSLFDTFGLGAFFGVVGGIIAIICLGVYPVTQRIVIYAAAGVAALFLVVAIPRKLFS